MKTPGQYKTQFIEFLQQLYHADETSRAAIHWWWFKRLVDILYKPTLVIIYIFNYIPPFSWLYHALEGIFGKNGYIGVGSVAGLYIAIYGVAQSSNQDELDRQERAIEKHEAAMKLSDPDKQREKMHGMRGLVNVSAQPVQLKPVFRCPIKYGDCETYWFELAQYRLDSISDELGHFYAQCHKNRDCNQSAILNESKLFNLTYLKEDQAYIGFNDFKLLETYISDVNHSYRYSPEFISYQIYQSITPLIDLKNLQFKNLDVSRWQLFHSQLRDSRFEGTKGELLDMRNSVYRRVTFNNIHHSKWLLDGSLIDKGEFNNANISVAILQKGLSLHQNIIKDSSISFDRMRNFSLYESTLSNVNISIENLSMCASAKDIYTPKDSQEQAIFIDDIRALYVHGDFAASQALYSKKLRCNMTLPNGNECRFISKNQCLTPKLSIVTTDKLYLKRR